MFDFRSFAANGPGRGILFAALGFGFAGWAGILSGWFLFRSGLIKLVVNSVSQAQPLQRLLVAIFLFVLAMAVSGAVIGGIIGWLLSLIDPRALRRRYVWAGAIAFATSQTLVVSLLLLWLSLLGIYYNNIGAQSFHFAILFAVIGFAYGVVSGVILGFASVGFKYGWSVLLASMVGGLLGGALTGLLLRLTEDAIRIGDHSINIWLVVGMTFLFFSVMGAPIGLIYTWFNRQRRGEGHLPKRMTRFWQLVVFFATSMLGVSLLGGAYHLYVFAGMHPPSTASIIASESVGVAWGEPKLVGEGAAAFSPGFVAGPNKRLALVWTRHDSTCSKIMLSLSTMDNLAHPTWEAPVVISSPDGYAQHPQIAVDSHGILHVVWEEATTSDLIHTHIMYSRCTGATCTEPTDLTAQPASCTSDTGSPSLPVVAVDAFGRVMVAWQTLGGDMQYASWLSDGAPSNTPKCLPFSGSKPQLAAVAQGQFILAFESAGEVIFILYREGAWFPRPLWSRPGSNPIIFYDGGDRFHAAWCGEDGRVNYWVSKSDNIGSPEVLNFPHCSGRPSLVRDGVGRLHLLWSAAEIVNNFGVINPGNFIYDSVRGDREWHTASVAAATRTLVAPSAVAGPDGAMFMTWVDDAGKLVWQAAQPHYNCPESTGSIYGDAILAVLTSGKYRPSDAFIPYCRNDYHGLLYLPVPVPSFSQKTESEYGGFDDIAAEIRGAQYEVLFTNMEWMADENDDSPGYVFARAIVDLYHSLETHPEAYPRGITVRILLGNYPELASFTWGEQIWNVLDVLQKAGLPELENPQLGWKVELANFDGQNPHSHAKFLVIDGRMVTAAGFNYSYLHLSEAHPSGLGVSLVDFGMAFYGPVAQDAVADFDDLWSGAEKVVCPGMSPPRGKWARYCTFRPVDEGHVPETLLYRPTTEDDVAFSLLRTYNRPESDEALTALLRSAQETIDIFEVNFSLKAYCVLGIIMEDFCTVDDSLPYMQALLDTMEKNGVHIRVLTTDVNMNGIENSVAIETFRKELARRGLSDLAEFRYYTGRMHTKAFVVDGQFLVVGSQNFHYSAWGDGSGLVEYNLATDSPAAIADFRRAFDYYWKQGTPAIPGQVRSE